MIDDRCPAVAYRRQQVTQCGQSRFVIETRNGYVQSVARGIEGFEQRSDTQQRKCRALLGGQAIQFDRADRVVEDLAGRERLGGRCLAGIAERAEPGGVDNPVRRGGGVEPMATGESPCVTPCAIVRNRRIRIDILPVEEVTQLFGRGDAR